MKYTRHDTMLSSQVVDVTEAKMSKAEPKSDVESLPFLSKDEDNYDMYVKRIKNYKTSHPALYFKMLNWD